MVWVWGVGCGMFSGSVVCSGNFEFKIFKILMESNGIVFAQPCLKCTNLTLPYNGDAKLNSQLSTSLGASLTLEVRRHQILEKLWAVFHDDACNS